MKTCTCCGKTKDTKDFCDTKCRVTYHRKGNASVTNPSDNKTISYDSVTGSNASVTESNPDEFRHETGVTVASELPPCPSCGKEGRETDEGYYCPKCSKAYA